MFSKVGSIVIALLCVVKAGTTQGVEGVVVVVLISLVAIFVIWVAPETEKVGTVVWPEDSPAGCKGLAWLALIVLFLAVFILSAPFHK